MSDAAGMAFFFAAGGALGVFYFYGLWITVRRAPSARRPGLAIWLSFAARVTAVLSVFYLTAALGRIELIAAAALGFAAARRAAVRAVIAPPGGKG